MKRNNRKKSMTLLVSLLLAVCLTVGGTLAFLTATDGPVENIFNPSQVTTKVEETLSGTTKSNVMIRNTGDIDAWIRAAVIVTWQNSAGEVYGKAPVAGTDYTIDKGNWLEGEDGFYYWNKPVAPNGLTGNLIDSITPGNTAPDGYYLNVEIIGSGIQSKPASVFNTEWASSGLTANEACTQLNKK